MAFSPRTLRLPAVAAIVLLAAAFAPGKAHAECGDYVMVGKHAADGMSSKPAVPCHGPHCSQRSNMPLVPPAPPPSAAPVDWAAFIARLHVPTDSGRDFLRGDISAYPIRLTDSIFHPPRLNG
jgi:hypothetical protein